MFFSFYKIIISNNEIEKNEKNKKNKKDEKKNDDRIDKKGVDFERLYDFEMIFSKVYNSFLSLNKLRFLKNSKKVNNFDF